MNSYKLTAHKLNLVDSTQTHVLTASFGTKGAAKNQIYQEFGFLAWSYFDQHGDILPISYNNLGHIIILEEITEPELTITLNKSQAKMLSTAVYYLVDTCKRSDAPATFDYVDNLLTEVLNPFINQNTK